MLTKRWQGCLLFLICAQLGTSGEYVGITIPSEGGGNEPTSNHENRLIYYSYTDDLSRERARRGLLTEDNQEIFSARREMADIPSIVSLATTDPNSSNLAGVFCVALTNAESTALQQGLNWACGPGMANCTAIQPGEPCYVENNLVDLASYAYNNYYHQMAGSGGSCNFSNTATITNTDPSHGSCIFAGSTLTSTNSSGGSSTNSSTSTNTTTGGGGTTTASIGGAPSNDNFVPISAGSRVLVEVLMIPYVVVLVLLFFF
ncbi:PLASMODESMATA CALLOSE-BINDING PROTEIN 5-like [Ananas comosus]|uniref:PLASMODESMATA CALLOSE-BINDING PROTEIN 5-like n=1 Tax=Ananas comosus TaxID=4615 RepID=A0A6P5G6B0_ANACO|nr:PLASMODESMATA CALLOSE-BINDING PROTEIN 5-like [Ananas comosus]XP_020101301.1 PLASMODESMATA CALLOSE-BINDING PROTEIN 5-like [Ananas comosus]